jgi:hypothetical protein
MDDIERARKRNQALVRSQRKALGLGQDPDERVKVQGWARAPVWNGVSKVYREGDEEPLGQMPCGTSLVLSPEQWLDWAWDTAEKEMRRDIEARGGFSLAFRRVTRLDGERELHCEFSRYMKRAEAQAWNDSLDAVEEAARGITH